MTAAPPLVPDARMLHEHMTFGHAIDLYIADMRADGRIASNKTEVSYRACLNAHADDMGDRDPRSTFREDVKRTLRRWQNPNTQRVRRACLVSFYDWTMQELDPPRDNNPARQTRPPRTRKPSPYRMTQQETRAFLQAAKTQREQRIAYLGVLAGVRLEEFRGLQGQHFQRAGFIWVSADIAKGGRERWIPVLPELVALVEEIRATVASDEYVIPAERWRDPGRNTVKVPLKKRPPPGRCSATTLWRSASGRASVRTSRRTRCAAPSPITSPGRRTYARRSSCSATPRPRPRRLTSARPRRTSWRQQSETWRS